jgi:hypothetical protein
LLFSSFFVPLLTLLAAELYNILAFHRTLSPYRSGVSGVRALGAGFLQYPAGLTEF